MARAFGIIYGFNLTTSHPLFFSCLSLLCFTEAFVFYLLGIGMVPGIYEVLVYIFLGFVFALHWVGGRNKHSLSAQEGLFEIVWIPLTKALGMSSPTRRWMRGRHITNITRYQLRPYTIPTEAILAYVILVDGKDTFFPHPMTL